MKRAKICRKKVASLSMQASSGGQRVESRLEPLLRHFAGPTRGIAAWQAFATLLLALSLSPAFAGAGPAPRDAGGFRLEAVAFRAGGFIPATYTCSGANVSPALTWTNPPAGTESLALIVADPDAPGGTWIHWVVYNLPPRLHHLPKHVPKVGEISGGGLQGTTSFREIGYGGPCPPPGRAHHYHFLLFALNVRLRLKVGATSAEVEKAMKGHILARAEIVGLFKRE